MSADKYNEFQNLAYNNTEIDLTKVVLVLTMI